MRSLIIALSIGISVGIIAGCETVDKAATISAESINSYCRLSQSAREAWAAEVLPKLDEGICIDLDCPGDAPDKRC